MPYFIYRVSPQKFLKQVDQFDVYADARARARVMRAAQAPGELDLIKIIFAKDAPEAEALLKAKREKRLREDD